MDGLRCLPHTTFFFRKLMCHSPGAVISYCPFCWVCYGVSNSPIQHVVVLNCSRYGAPITNKWSVTLLTSHCCFYKRLFRLRFQYTPCHIQNHPSIQIFIWADRFWVFRPYLTFFCPLLLFFARGNKFLKCVPCTWDSHFPPACKAMLFSAEKKLFAVSEQSNADSKLQSR